MDWDKVSSSNMTAADVLQLAKTMNASYLALELWSYIAVEVGWNLVVFAITSTSFRPVLHTLASRS